MWAVPSKVIFCSSLMLIWPGILPRYVSSPFLIAPSVPMITGIVSVLMPHIRFVSISKSLYLDIIIIIIIVIIYLFLFFFCERGRTATKPRQRGAKRGEKKKIPPPASL